MRKTALYFMGFLGFLILLAKLDDKPKEPKEYVAPHIYYYDWKHDRPIYDYDTITMGYDVGCDCWKQKNHINAIHIRVDTAAYFNDDIESQVIDAMESLKD